ncbi:hypothetical protein COS86_01455, partial [Candidatus Bathyarchaeota archaeon CG07_land_8_20_14_0_80_47_9]
MQNPTFTLPIQKNLYCKAVFIVNAQKEVCLSLSSASAGGVPVLVLKEGSNRSRGKEAQHTNIMAAKIVAETAKSC